MPTTQTIVNGLDTDAIRALANQVSREPASGVATFQVASRWTGGVRSEARVSGWRLGGERKPRNFAIRSDEPRELLGDARDPNPQELLMAGLNACMLVGYVAGCAVHGVELESLSIETEGSLDLRGFLGLDPSVNPGYDEIRYTVRIKGKGSPEKFKQVHETVMKTSPNFHNLSRPVRLVPRLVVE